jgi:hypothetical protein
MLAVVVLVDAAMHTQDVDGSQRFGAASMFSVFILGSCIVYRSLQCTWVVLVVYSSIDIDIDIDNPDHHWWMPSVMADS